MRKVILSAVVLLITAATFAQTKVGTIDPDFILSKMPELAQAQEELKKYNAELEADMKVKLADYEAKVKAYQTGEASMLDADKKLKQDEIIKLEQDIAQFRQNGAQLLQLKQNEVVQPLYKKIGDVLAVVAKEQGYTQVLTIGNNNNLAYIDQTYDLTKAVMDKMGIKPE